MIVLAQESAKALRSFYANAHGSHPVQRSQLLLPELCWASANSNDIPIFFMVLPNLRVPFFFSRVGSAWALELGLAPWSRGPLVPRPCSEPLVLVLWSPHPLVPWSSGPLVPWSSGLLVPWSLVAALGRLRILREVGKKQHVELLKRRD